MQKAIILQYKSNLAVLSRAYAEDLENEFIISGIINKFFIQFELSWKVLKELLRYEGKNIENICRSLRIKQIFLNQEIIGVIITKYFV